MEANTKILSKDVVAKLDSLCIAYYALKKSKSNELAFTSNNKKNREFEIKFLNDGTYKVSTRYLGYKKIMDSTIGFTQKTKDPDQRRYSFSVIVDSKEGLNCMLLEMLNKGYDINPKVELI